MGKTLILKAYHGDKNPGDLIEFDDEEAARQIAIGGARELTAEEIEKLAAAAKAKDAAEAHTKLMAMTGKDLQALADENKIDLGDASKKEDIIAAIELHTESTGKAS